MSHDKGKVVFGTYGQRKTNPSFGLELSLPLTELLANVKYNDIAKSLNYMASFSDQDREFLEDTFSNGTAQYYTLEEG